MEQKEVKLHDEVFYARNKLTGARILHYGAAMGRGGTGLYSACEDFFAEVFDAEEHARFDAFINSPDREIKLNDLFVAFDALIAEYMRDETRPTQPPAP